MTHDQRTASVGIASIGRYLPRGVETSRDMAERSGYPEYVFLDKIGVRQKPVATADEHPTDMGIAAARDALERAGVDPADVGLVVFCGVFFSDYGVWSPAARIQHEIGATGAFAYEIKNGCNSGNFGMYLASRQLMADPDLEYALIVCSDVASPLVDYRDENLLSMYPMGDAATAALLQRNHPGNRILAQSGISDGSLAEAVFVPAGGTRCPRDSGGPGGGPGYLRIDDPAALAAVFANVYLENYVKVIRDALRKCDRAVEEIAFLFTNQVKQSTLDAVLEELGLTRDKTRRTMEWLGHLTASDTFLALEESLDEGRIGNGDLVVLASSGIGFHWAATVLEF